MAKQLTLNGTMTTEAIINQKEQNSQDVKKVRTECQYQSLAVPTIFVDVSNFLTEILVERKRGALPNVEFWQKQYADTYKDLTDLYIMELTQVKKLLKVFSPVVLVEYIQKSKLSTLRYLTKEQAKDVIYDLFAKQVKYIQSIKEIKKTEIEFIDDKLEFVQTKLRNNNAIAKGL